MTECKNFFLLYFIPEEFLRLPFIFTKLILAILKLIQKNFGHQLGSWDMQDSL